MEELEQIRDRLREIARETAELHQRRNRLIVEAFTVGWKIVDISRASGMHRVETGRLIHHGTPHWRTLQRTR